MALHFNVKGLINELLKNLIKELAVAYEKWENEVYRYLRKPYLGYNLKSRVEWEINRESKKIISYLKANSYVLADSYGTGSLMLKDNPGYAKYKNSDLWNPDRVGNAITGRRAGTYTDIFGRKRSSKGTLKGVNLEGRYFGTGYRIKPTAPSYAIQMADKWLHDTYLPRAYKNAVKATNFAKFLIEDKGG